MTTPTQPSHASPDDPRDTDHVQSSRVGSKKGAAEVDPTASDPEAPARNPAEIPHHQRSLAD
jgi:hypothetical protein